MATQERKWAMAEVTKERKLAKEVGVINLETLRQYQNTIRDDDETIAESRKELAAMKAKPIACSNAVVAEIAECLPVYTPRSESLTPEECRTGQVLEYLRLTRDPRD
jgi:hypothetical protein